MLQHYSRIGSQAKQAAIRAVVAQPGRADEAPAGDQGGIAVCALRKMIVEPVFGEIKQGRGFRQFLLRGLEKVRGEWALLCMTHSIPKVHRLCYG